MQAAPDKKPVHKLAALQVSAFGNTDIGRVRSTNQDSYLIDNSMQLYIVADGMGGHAGGEIASQLCIREISEFVASKKELFEQEASHPSAAIAAALMQAINHASGKIFERALEDPKLKGMGTTATLVKIVGRQAYCAHVGDSRLYLIRAGFLYQLTNDHSLVGEQVRAGILTKEEAEAHHLKNVITRSVGYQEEEDVDTLHLEMEPNDIFVICSDGLHGKVADDEIYNITKRDKTSPVNELIQLANERGGDDNISVILLSVKDQA